MHRDVTPANILLDPDGPWLADFGIARRVDATAMTDEGLLIGTAGLPRPGGDRGRPRPGRPSDRYALAAVAFEALAGRAAVHGRRRPGAPLRPRQPRRPAGLVAAAGPAAGVDAALLRGLAKDPRDRPRDAPAR